MAEDVTQVQIENPWIVIHQPGGNGHALITILSGMEGANHTHFAIIAADLIKVIANQFSMDVEEITSLIAEEINNPTAELVNHKLQ